MKKLFDIYNISEKGYNDRRDLIIIILYLQLKPEAFICIALFTLVNELTGNMVEGVDNTTLSARIGAKIVSRVNIIYKPFLFLCV